MKEITKELFREFEIVREAAPCNMIDFRCIQRFAYDGDLFELAAMTKQQHRAILANYSELKEKFGDE